jgi:hypothetical protein
VRILKEKGGKGVGEEEGKIERCLGGREVVL